MTQPALSSDVIAAQQRAENARTRLLATLGQVQDKMHPMTLAQDAVENVALGVMRDTVETVRARPRTMAAAAGLAVLFMARKPLARLFWSGAKNATAAGSASLKARRDRRSTKGSTT